MGSSVSAGEEQFVLMGCATLLQVDANSTALARY